jgi:hypothetical protein
VLPPAVAITADVHVARSEVTDGASASQVGSPMIRTVYRAKSAAVIASHAVPLTTVTLKPKFVAMVCSTLGLPVTVSPLINAVPDTAEAGDAKPVASAPSPAALNVARASATTRAFFQELIYAYLKKSATFQAFLSWTENGKNP